MSRIEAAELERLLSDMVCLMMGGVDITIRSVGRRKADAAMPLLHHLSIRGRTATTTPKFRKPLIALRRIYTYNNNVICIYSGCDCGTMMSGRRRVGG